MSLPLEKRDRETFLNVSTTIADRICNEAKWNERACTWKTPVGQGRYRIVWREADAFLYQGTAGIALFLLRIYKVVSKRRYLTTARGAMAHAVALERRADAASGGYYSGTAGVASACLELASATDDSVWCDEALRLCGRIEKTLFDGATEGPRRLDLLAGEAGSLLGLLEVHHATGDVRALRTARRLGDLLVAEARREPEGVSWNTQRPAVFRNLLGLSHGAGGIALALLELHRYTGEPLYFFCATEALRYEDSFLRGSARSWPDLRCKALAERLVDGKISELRKSVAAGTFDYGEPQTVDAWCHGAPGIGLVRHRFLTVTGLDLYRPSLLRALEATTATLEAGEIFNYSLCHGVCGNAEVLDWLRPHLGSDEDHARNLVIAAARYGIKRVHRRDDRWHTGFPGGAISPSLMVGEAGVGLFYLRLADPNIPSVLLPDPHVSVDGGHDEIGLRAGEDLLGGATDWWCSLHFPRTISALRGADVEPLPAADLDPPKLVRDLERHVESSPRGSREMLREVLALESAAFERTCERPYIVHSFVEGLIRRRVDTLQEPETRVVIAPSSRLCETAYDWESLDLQAPELDHVARRTTTYLIHEVRESVEIHRLSGLTGQMYSLLREPITVAALLDRLIEHLTTRQLLDSATDSDTEAVRRQLLERLQRAYAAHEIEIVEPCDLTPQDIDSATCTRCGECCRIKISIPGDAVYAEFVREMLEEPLRAAYPEIAIYHQDDRETPHVVVDLGDCRHLRRRETDSSTRVACDIYERRPAVCARFNCVAWWREQRSVAVGRTTADRVIEKVVRIRVQNS